MSTRLLASVLLSLSMLLAIHLVQASHISLSGPPPQLHLAVGSLGATIDTVSFNVSAASLGSGVPVTGSQSVLIEVAVRRGGGPGGGPTTAFLLANSSVPLTSGPNTIPMTEISWTNTDSVIPAGTFDGSAAQQLLVFAAPNGNTRREDTLNFSYANTITAPAGTYRSTVVYTALVI